MSAKVNTIAGSHLPMGISQHRAMRTLDLSHAPDFFYQDISTAVYMFKGWDWRGGGGECPGILTKIQGFRPGICPL